jgi:excinuclease UvrABC ATPase subunit
VADYGSIEVRGARENNLRDVSVDIPKRKLTVVTGVSGSGKSSLVFDTIAAESRRLINETYSAFVQGFMPHYGRPDVDTVENLSAAIVVDQARMGNNARSTVGTATDVSSLLRILYSRFGEPRVFPASALSFNDPAGMCPACEGLGRASTVDIDALLDRDRSLNEDPIRFPNFAVESWYWRSFAASGLFDPAMKLRDYPPDVWQEFLYGAEKKFRYEKVPLTFEGLVPKLRRLYLAKEPADLQPHIRRAVERVTTSGPCPECGGTRLNETVRASKIDGVSIADCAAMQVDELLDFVRKLRAPGVELVLKSLTATLGDLVHIGLGYLSLDRASSTLSGGESQRVRMVRHLGSPLTDITYVFDEPSVGLHAHDVARLNELLLRLRDKGNTVLVVEHKAQVVGVADHVVDLGPGAGNAGGEIVYQGTVAGLRKSRTLTGRHLAHRRIVRTDVRTPSGSLRVEHASLHNLQDLAVDIPTGVLTAVTGVAGSGKSSLVLGVLPQQHPDVIVVDQGLTRGSSRSNTATWTGMLEPIRKAFAKANDVKPALFSANSEGACPVCKGLGLIYTDLQFLDTAVSVCEACEGRRFTAEVLAYELDGRNIADVLAMSVVEARAYWSGDRVVTDMLASLADVGLGYVTLGQPLSTLSGGERQRLKLAVEMAGDGSVYLLDEPTGGLHMDDVDRLIGLLHRLVDDGRTVVVVEHNLDVVARADWVIDLGPGAGHDGGRVVFSGTPADLVRAENSLTGGHLRGRVQQTPSAARASRATGAAGPPRG